jgi:hypothetical protein
MPHPIQNMKQECHHDWCYAGVVFSFGDRLPGSNANERVYEDRFYCRHCLATKDINRRVFGNTYQKLVEGSMPK